MLTTDDLIVGDKNALLIATRILGYGKEYDIVVKGSKLYFRYVNFRK
jgi:hypothetical protein